MAIELPTVTIEEATEHGTFAFAEPYYGGRWAVFRTIQNGKGPKTITAELFNAKGGLERRCTYPLVQKVRRDGREPDTVRMGQLQATNELRKLLGVV